MLFFFWRPQLRFDRVFATIDLNHHPRHATFFHACKCETHRLRPKSFARHACNAKRLMCTEYAYRVLVSVRVYVYVCCVCVCACV
jgi:hypothetical protein